MRLHWHPFSIFPRRVRVALREKRLPYEDVFVDLPNGGTRTPEFLRLNPFGHVPVLEDDGVVLYESLAILEYLEERQPDPALLPAERAARGRARQFMCASGDYLAGPLKRWLSRIFSPEPTWDRPDQERALAEMAAHFDVLERELGGREYLAGPFSLADVAYVPLVCDLELCGLESLVALRPAVRAWIARLNGRDSVVATRPQGI
jgi:glutathione S-transferase